MCSRLGVKFNVLTENVSPQAIRQAKQLVVMYLALL